jgi:hypothetical protein
MVNNGLDLMVALHHLLVMAFDLGSITGFNEGGQLGKDLHLLP